MIRGEIVVAGGSALISEVYKTTNAMERARGLLGRGRLEAGQAILLEPCAAIHTIGMGYPLDVAFLNEAGRVVKVASGLRPFRFASARGARAALEMNSGAMDRLGIVPGVRLEWRGA